MACGDGARDHHCPCRHMDFLIGSYLRVGKDAIIQRMDKLDDTTGGILEDQAIFDNTLKSIRSHQEDYEAKLETMLVEQQGMVDKMIKYLENVKDRMRELERRAGVPAPGPDLPRDPAPESLVRRLRSLRTAAEGVAPMEGPMESAPYGPPQVDPSLLRHIPLFSASAMLGEQTPEKGSGTGTPKRDTREGTVEIDMSSRQPLVRPMLVQRMSVGSLKWIRKYVEDQVGNPACKIRGRTYGPWSVRAWKKPNLNREKTWKSEESTPTPRAAGVVEVSVLEASLLWMLETLYVSKTSGV